MSSVVALTPIDHLYVVICNATIIYKTTLIYGDIYLVGYYIDFV